MEFIYFAIFCNFPVGSDSKILIPRLFFHVTLSATQGEGRGWLHFLRHTICFFFQIKDCFEQFSISIFFYGMDKMVSCILLNICILNNVNHSTKQTDYTPKPSKVKI